MPEARSAEGETEALVPPTWRWRLNGGDDGGVLNLWLLVGFRWLVILVILISSGWLVIDGWLLVDIGELLVSLCWFVVVSDG